MHWVVAVERRIAAHVARAVIEGGTDESGEGCKRAAWVEQEDEEETPRVAIRANTELPEDINGGVALHGAGHVEAAPGNSEHGDHDNRQCGARDKNVVKVHLEGTRERQKLEEVELEQREPACRMRQVGSC